ncbi:MAG: hypothetical protein IVW53_15500 [Chloroflexi bacterium]|nr:hypothetical protein [Chloroflexota bacterium]
MDEDHGGQRYRASDLVAWDSDAVRAVLEAAAEAEGLPRSSWPTRRAGTPAVLGRRCRPSEPSTPVRSESPDADRVD